MPFPGPPASTRLCRSRPSRSWPAGCCSRLDVGVVAGWLTADEIYGQDKRLRVWCEQHGLPHVLAPAPTPPWP